MCLWHFCWDLTLFGLLDRAAMQSWTAQLVRAFIVCSFVLLAGISSRYSRSNGRRCLRLALCAAAVSLATAAVGEPVRFGMLHLLAVGTGVYALLRNALDRLPGTGPRWPCGACCLPAGTFVPARVRVSVPGCGPGPAYPRILFGGLLPNSPLAVPVFGGRCHGRPPPLQPGPLAGLEAPPGPYLAGPSRAGDLSDPSAGAVGFAVSSGRALTRGRFGAMMRHTGRDGKPPEEPLPERVGQGWKPS